MLPKLEGTVRVLDGEEWYRRAYVSGSISEDGTLYVHGSGSFINAAAVVRWLANVEDTEHASRCCYTPLRTLQISTQSLCLCLPLVLQQP